MKCFLSMKESLFICKSNDRLVGLQGFMINSLRFSKLLHEEGVL